jgi:5-formyltetrahydrofolate cyclo-ligase
MKEQRTGMKPRWVRVRSELIQGKILAMERFAKARSVGCYLAAPAEVRTDRILKACWAAGKDVSVPAFCRESGTYVLARMERGSPMAAGPMGIRQPAALIVADLE